MDAEETTEQSPGRVLPKIWTDAGTRRFVELMGCDRSEESYFAKMKSKHLSAAYCGEVFNKNDTCSTINPFGPSSRRIFIHASLIYHCHINIQVYMAYTLCRPCI